MSYETCEICGENVAQKEKYVCTITGSEWYMCKQCEDFFKQMNKEMEQYSREHPEEFDEFDLEID